MTSIALPLGPAAGLLNERDAALSIHNLFDPFCSSLDSWFAIPLALWLLETEGRLGVNLIDVGEYTVP